VRLAQVRDGVEDYEWFQLAEARAGKAAVEPLLKELVTSMTEFLHDPRAIRALRSRVADLIEASSHP
jgi:chemotaxis methyl-accepting protein methylase